MTRPLLLALLLAAAPALAEAPAGGPDAGPVIEGIAGAPDVAPVIEGIEEDLGVIRGIIADMEDARDLSLPLLADKGDYREALDGHLDTILSLVLGDIYGESRRDLFALDDEARRLSERLADLAVDRLTAPRSADVAGLLDATLNRWAEGSVEAIDAEAAGLRAQADEIARRREALLARFAAALMEGWGVAVSPQEAEAALYQVNGITIVESAMAFEVVRRIEERLGQIRQATDDDAVLRRYYAVAAVTRLLVQRLYERHLHDYDAEWLPRLAAIEARNDRLMAETEAAVAAADPVRRAAYEGNLAVQRQVAEVIDAYRAMLVERRDLTERGLAVARADADVALNTLRTLEAAVSLQGQMIWSRSEFETLMEIAPPELIPLDDEEMFRRFLDVSRELAGTS